MLITSYFRECWSERNFREFQILTANFQNVGHEREFRNFDPEHEFMDIDVNFNNVHKLREFWSERYFREFLSRMQFHECRSRAWILNAEENFVISIPNLNSFIKTLISGMFIKKRNCDHDWDFVNFHHDRDFVHFGSWTCFLFANRFFFGIFVPSYEFRDFNPDRECIISLN